MLTISAVYTSQSFSNCQKTEKIESCSPSRSQVLFCFFSLYLLAVAGGGYKTCNQAFGADQFEEEDPEEGKAKSSYFNWSSFCICIGLSVSMLTLSYIQDNLNWVLGFGIPCIAMVVALLLFLIGTNTYRYSIERDEKSPIMRICMVFVEAARIWRTTSLPEKAIEEGALGALSHQGSQECK